MDFIWETAIRRMVSLSGFRARALQVGTMSDSSVMYWVILLRRRRSISLWFSLKQRKGQLDAWRGYRLGTTSQPCLNKWHHDTFLSNTSPVFWLCFTTGFVNVPKLQPMICLSKLKCYRNGITSHSLQETVGRTTDAIWLNIIAWQLLIYLFRDVFLSWSFPLWGN